MENTGLSEMNILITLKLVKHRIWVDFNVYTMVSMSMMLIW